MKIYKDKIAYVLIGKAFFVDTTLGLDNVCSIEIEHATVNFESAVCVRHTQYSDRVAIRNYNG